MFTAALLTVAKTWKQSKYPTTDEWTNKTWYLRTRENDLGLKTKKILTNGTTWMNLMDTVLSETSQTQRANLG